MAKFSPFALLEIILAVAAIFLMILGNILAIGGLTQADVGAFMVLALGFFASAMYFLFALLVTVTNREDTDNADLIAANMIAAPLLVGNIFTIGSFLDDLPKTQSVFLDIGLIIGLFFVFCTSYLWLKEKWDFLEIEDIDFLAGTDKERYPQFFLATLMLGAVYAGLYIIFKILYLTIEYNWTCYIFLGVIFIYAVLLAFGHEIVGLVKK